MRIPTIWYKHSEEFEIDNWEKTPKGGWRKNGKVLLMHNFIGGSTRSEQDAKNQALKKRDIIQSKIEVKYDYRNPPDYEIDIREEVIAKINDRNIITRNRYGALVLNSEHMMIVDVDNDKAQYRLRASAINPFAGLISLFVKTKTYSPGLLGRLEKVLDRESYRHLYTRIYKTPNGYRLIIQGEEFVARSKQSSKLMQLLYVDRQYADICYQQQCYRARLTPKPWRINMKRPKIIFPFRTAEEDTMHNEWVRNYQNNSEGYSACRLISEIGRPMQSRAVEYHDKFCRALSNLPMA